MESLGALFLLLLIAWFWFDSLRARETAILLSHRACQRQDVQFLDQAVALVQIGLVWTRDGLRLRRVYLFEYSHEGLERRAGAIVLRGLELERLDLPPAGDLRTK